MKARYAVATIGTKSLMARMKDLYLSIMGEVIAAARRPTTMRMAPAMPAAVSEKLKGSRIWLRREEMELKRPT